MLGDSSQGGKIVKIRPPPSLASTFSKIVKKISNISNSIFTYTFGLEVTPVSERLLLFIPAIIIIPSLPLFRLLTLPSLLFCPSTCLLWVKMLSNEFLLSVSLKAGPPIKEPPLSFIMVLFSPPTLVGLLRLSCFWDTFRGKNPMKKLH